MKKVLVCYFSASGVTRRVALKISEALKCDIFEIKPVDIYTKEDLDWTNKESRSSIEMSDLNSRPKISNKVENMSDYDVIIIGYPIWWYTAPTIINTFLEENDFAGKKIYLFATSGSSGIEKSMQDLNSKYPDLDFVSARRFTGSETVDIFNEWINV